MPAEDNVDEKRFSIAFLPFARRSEAERDGAPLPAAYRRIMRWWFWLGWPAFLGVIAIFWLMVTKPG